MVSQFFSLKSKSGFTILEIMIVLAIISILSLVSVGSYQNTQKSTRDAKRKIDLESVRQVLELYKSDHGNQYLPYKCSPDGNLANWSTELAPYLKTIPTDPQSDKGKRYEYVTLGCSGSGCSWTCTKYALCAHLENSTGTPTYCTGAASCGNTSCNYETLSP